MISPLTYIGLLFKRASQKSILLTDQLTILIVPFTTLMLWMAGAKMTATIQETLALGVAITVVIVVGLRLVAASYFVWKDDQARKAELRHELDDPERQVSASLKAYTTDRRKELSEKLALLSAIANYKTEFLPRFGITEEKLGTLALEIDALINQLSYDANLRVAAIRLKEYCSELIAGTNENRERLWAQRKLTFRLIHKEDHIADFMTLLELELLTEENWHSSQEDDDWNALKALVTKLGNAFHDPEVRRRMREALARKEDKFVRRTARARESLQDIEATKQQ